MTNERRTLWAEVVRASRAYRRTRRDLVYPKALRNAVEQQVARNSFEAARQRMFAAFDDYNNYT